MLRVIVLVFAILIGETNGAASNSYADCLQVAAKFQSTVSNGPVANITAATGVTVQCTQLTGVACPGSIINGVCTWQKKLSVTCIPGSPVRIRVQSNGLPSRCSSVPSTVKFSEVNIDFEVNFNPDVSINSPVHTPTTQSALDSIVCNTRGQSSVPSKSAFVARTTMSLAVVAGVAIDNVAILNANMANGGDPFHPLAGSEPERVDLCLGHPQMTGIYHYHMASGCIVSPPSGTTSPCSRDATCHANISAYSIKSFPATSKTLTVIGIAKDGHVIYGPYLNDARTVTTGTDICNGMFHDSIGNYGYFATQKFPYITGCFGPSNYPKFGPSCTTNGPTSYSMSSYAANFYKK